MATIITTSDAYYIEPTICLNISSERASQNIIHVIPGRANPDVTLRPASLRTGTLELGFQGEYAEPESEDAEWLFAQPEVFTIQDEDRATLSFSFVPSGRIERVLEDQSRDAWIVRVDYTEVAAS